MARCPVCESLRVVVVVASTRRAFCTACGAQWIQEGSLQRAVQKLWARTDGVPGPAGGDRSA
jgi:Zn-finger nucleic acid-binding protein